MRSKHAIPPNGCVTELLHHWTGKIMREKGEFPGEIKVVVYQELDLRSAEMN